MLTYAAILTILGFAAVLALWRMVEQNRHIITRLDGLSNDITSFRFDAVNEIQAIKSEVEAISATISSPKTDA